MKSQSICPKPTIYSWPSYFGEIFLDLAGVGVGPGFPNQAILSACLWNNLTLGTGFEYSVHYCRSFLGNKLGINLSTPRMLEEPKKGARLVS
eukprot:2095144-Amphidinium_carterae.1